MLEEHGGGEDLRQGVGEVLTGSLGPRAVDGFEERRVLTERRRGLQAHGTGDAGGLVGEDVAEGVLGDDDVEETGLGEHAHRGIVDEHIVGAHLGILGFHLLGDLAPQTAGGQHVGLVDDGQVLVALHGHLETEFQDALDLGTGVDIGIVGHVVVLMLLSEVHAAREFAQHDEVGTADEFILQRRLVEQTVEGDDGTHVGIEAQFLTHGQQTGLGTDLGRWVVVELQVADGSKEHGIGTHTHLVGAVGIGISDGLDGMGATDGLLVFKLMSTLGGYRVEHSDTLFHNLGADTIACENSNLQFHNSFVFSFS